GAGGDVHHLSADFRGGSGGGQQVGGDDVVNVGEVAALLPIAKDLGDFAGQHGGDELGQHGSVGGARVLVGSEDVEVADGHRGHAVAGMESRQIMLTRQLGDGVGRERSRQKIFALGQGGAVAIGRRGSGIDDALDAGGASRDQQVDGGIHIGAIAGQRIGDRTRDAGDGGLVEDYVHIGTRAGGGGRVSQVGLDEVEAGAASQVLALAGGEVVNAAHRVAALE